MNNEDLVKLLGNHEDNFIERKSDGVKQAEIRQTVCAFANSLPEGRHGVLFIGLHDKTGQPTGVANPDDMQKRIREACQNDCYPPIMFRSEVLPVDGHQVVAVVVPASKVKPHFTGPAYVRVGSESPKATPQLYEELILSRNDKTRAILQYGKQLFTVLGIGYKVGSNKLLNDSSYRESRDCIVDSCNAHTINLIDIASGRILTEPLAHVTVSFDNEKNRPLLLIRFPNN